MYSNNEYIIIMLQVSKVGWPRILVISCVYFTDCTPVTIREGAMLPNSSLNTSMSNSYK